MPKGQKRVMIILVVAVVLLVLLAAGFFAYQRYFAGRQVNENAPVNAAPNQNLPAVNFQEVNAEPLVNVNQPPPPMDEDADGLSAEEEGTAGTSDQDTDSDDDGLNDREEVKIYQTDPLDPDTDGDHFLDGEEVRNLYNPNGPGRLYKTEELQL